MIKYLGSKRKLVPVLGAIAEAVGATTAVDLFTGTTRVAQELKRRGIHTTAVDLASYSAVLSDCFVATDAADVDEDELADALAELDALPGPSRLLHRHLLRAVAVPAPGERRAGSTPSATPSRSAGPAPRCVLCSSPACSWPPTGSTRPPACRWPT